MPADLALIRVAVGLLIVAVGFALGVFALGVFAGSSGSRRVLRILEDLEKLDEKEEDKA